MTTILHFIENEIVHYISSQTKQQLSYSTLVVPVVLFTGTSTTSSTCTCTHISHTRSTCSTGTCSQKLAMSEMSTDALVPVPGTCTLALVPVNDIFVFFTTLLFYVYLLSRSNLLIKNVRNVK